MRQLNKNEINQIKIFFDLLKLELSELDKYYAIDLNDSGMGSIRFGLKELINQPINEPLRKISEKETIDSDGVPIIVTLFSNQFYNLFELDNWKVDFSKIIQYPNIN